MRICCPKRSRSMRFADSRIFRCRETAGDEILNGAVSSPTVASPIANCSRSARRVGSASAAKTALRLAIGHHGRPAVRRASASTGAADVLTADNGSAPPHSAGQLLDGAVTVSPGANPPVAAAGPSCAALSAGDELRPSAGVAASAMSIAGGHGRGTGAAAIVSAGGGLCSRRLAA